MGRLRALLAVAVGLAAVCGEVGWAEERPPALLVSADASTYAELNLDRLLGKAPETAAVRSALARVVSMDMIGSALASDEEAAAVFEEVVEVVVGFSEAVGPRLGCAVWIPDLSTLLGEAAMGAGIASEPKVLVVVEVRDGDVMRELVDHLLSTTGERVAHLAPYRGATVTVLGAGETALAQGEDWLVLGYPAEMMRAGVDRATGVKRGGSLWEDARYQRVLGSLPKDAVLTHYVSGEPGRQLLELESTLLPRAGSGAPREEGFGWAMGVRTEWNDGRQMLTVYATAELDTVSYVAKAMQAGLLAPVLMNVGKRSRKMTCVSNMRQINPAMQAYLADHNDRFPVTARWVDELVQYMPSEEALKCPADGSDARCSYGLNRALIGKGLSDVADLEELIVFYETRRPGESPVGGADDVVSEGRHEGGWVYGLGTGGVQWRARDQGTEGFEVE